MDVDDAPDVADDRQLEDDEHSEEDSEDSEFEEEDEKLVTQLEEQLLASPHSYQLHLQYVAALRSRGQLDKMRNAREAMAALFPLSPTLWLEWTKDEARLLNDESGSPEVAAVTALYERGVADYLSVPLWLEYAKFVEERDPDVAEMSAQGLEKIRALYERALSAGGLHLKEGHALWTAYRELEQAVLETTDTSDGEARAAQSSRLRKLFVRQLSTPHSNHEDTLEEYTAWEKAEANATAGCEQEMSPTLLAAYKKAEAAVVERQAWEEKVDPDKCDTEELLTNFLAYAKLEHSKGEIIRVHNVYERCVSACAIQHRGWAAYAQYCDTELKVPVVVQGVHARAVRNCPWVGALWCARLLALERMNASEEEAEKVFQEALQGGLQNPEEYLDLLLTRADGLRRRIQTTAAGEGRSKVVQTLSGTFKTGVDSMSSLFPAFVDPSLSLPTYWAHLEATLGNNVEAARAVWEGVLKSGAPAFESWMGYIGLEVQLGNRKEARGLYKRCFAKRFAGNGTQVLCAAWLHFERQKGSLEDYDWALAKVTPRLEEVSRLEASQASQAARQKPPPGSMRAPAPVTRNAPAGKEAKRKRGLGYTEPKAPKRPKPTPLPATEAPPSGGSADVDMGGEAGKPSAPVSTPASASAPPPVVYSDQCTAFLSNLPLNVREEEVRELFSGCGPVKDLRMVVDRGTKRFKGVAYLEFTEDASLNKALEFNKTRIRGTSMSVKRSNPPAKGGQRGGAGGGGGGGGGGERGGGGGEDVAVLFVVGKCVLREADTCPVSGWLQVSGRSGMRRAGEGGGEAGGGEGGGGRLRKPEGLQGGGGICS